MIAARTPVMDRLWTTNPRATLRCSGEDVGLPDGQMGNSEVGHLNLGAGFVVYQWLTRIDRAVADGTLAANPTLLAAIAHAKQHDGALHLLGLVSDGGVHSHVRHLEALLRLARDQGLDRVHVHAFTDGRDTSPTSGLDFVSRLERVMAELAIGRVATVSGRYYAMDRDRRWERIQAAYEAVLRGKGAPAESATQAIERSYHAGVTDEFIVPTVIRSDGGLSSPAPGDALLFFNFRADRGRQFVEAVTSPDFNGFPRGPLVPNLFVATMTRYEDGLPVHVVFEPQDVAQPVARVVSDVGFAQMHTAETEKYAHVTFFFNGGREEPFPGEERRLVPSPTVATYDLQPEMSAAGVTDATVRAIASGRYPFVIVNFANCDMVGHTGVFSAAVRAVETVDGCLGRVVEAVLSAGGVALVTADHGNAEEMIDRPTGRPITAHTTNPVPVVLVAPEDHPARHVALRSDGRLSAVAPTLLELLGVPAPNGMTEPSLISRSTPASSASEPDQERP